MVAPKLRAPVSEAGQLATVPRGEPLQLKQALIPGSAEQTLQPPQGHRVACCYLAVQWAPTPLTESRKHAGCQKGMRGSASSYVLNLFDVPLSVTFRSR